MKSKIFFLFVLYMMMSCTEIYELPNMGSKTTIVIAGLVTNEPGPYFVRVMENVSDMSTGIIIQRGIDNARVTITDNKGNVDILRSFYSVKTDSTLLYSGINYLGIRSTIKTAFICRVIMDSINFSSLTFQANIS